MQLFALELSFPVLLAAFSLCTSMLAVLGTVQLVISTPARTPVDLTAPSYPRDQAALEVGLGMEKRLLAPWLGNVSPTGMLPSGHLLSIHHLLSFFPIEPGFTPFESRPPLSMAKLIMLRHVNTPYICSGSRRIDKHFVG